MRMQESGHSQLAIPLLMVIIYSAHVAVFDWIFVYYNVITNFDYNIVQV